MARNELGALASMQGSAQRAGSQPVSSPEGDSGDSVGNYVTPQAPPPQSPQEREVRKEANKQWLQQPEVQAALLQFAVSIMQPVGGRGGAADFVGALGRSIGSGAQAAARVKLGREGREDREREADLQEREMQVREGGLLLDEAKLMKELREGNLIKQTVIVGDQDPLNEAFGLNIPPGQQAKVEVIKDRQGNVVNANVASEFGSGVLGDQKKGEIVRRNPDTGELEVVAVKNSERALEIQAAEEQQLAKWRQQQAEVDEVNYNVERALAALDNPMEVLGVEIPPDMYLTGIGSLSRFVPGTPAADLEELLTPIRARLGFRELQRMRDNSQSGGALGQVSNWENRLLQAAYQSLEQRQTAAQLRQNIVRIHAIFNDVVNEGKLAHINDLVESGAMSQEQADELAISLFGAPETSGHDVPPPEENPDEVMVLPEERPAHVSPEMWERVREVWDSMTPDERRIVIEGNLDADTE